MGAYYYLHCIDCNEESEGISNSSSQEILKNLWENREVLIAASNATYIGISIDGSCSSILGFLETHLTHKAFIINSYGDKFNDINQEKFIVIKETGDKNENKSN